VDAASAGVATIRAPSRYVLADAITAFVPLLAPRLFKRTQDNFIRAFGADCAARQLARASIRSFGRMAVDFLWVRTLSNEAVRQVTTLVGDDQLWEALRARRGAILVLPHLGCWDVAAARASAAGFPILIVTEGTWAARLASASRRRPGITLVSRESSMRELLRALKRNEGVVLLSDLARPGLQTVVVPFFGRPAALPSGPARLSARTGAPIIPVACIRTAICRYQVEFCAPIWPDAFDRKGERTVQTITAAIAGNFEELIRRHPDQWYPFGHIWSDPATPAHAPAYDKRIRGSTYA
jgi:KDO2-lipid IV(A) lauroyltransferase